MLSLDPDRILAGAPDAMWVDSARRALMVRAPAELACAPDGHLGYTQLVRLCEIARHALWRDLLPPNPDVAECIVVHFELNCRRKVLAGELVGIRPTLTAIGTTSFTVEMGFTSVDEGAELAGCVLTLVALDRAGRPVAVRPSADAARR